MEHAEHRQKIVLTRQKYHHAHSKISESYGQTNLVIVLADKDHLEHYSKSDLILNPLLVVVWNQDNSSHLVIFLPHGKRKLNK